MNYKNKETGEIVTLDVITQEFSQLINNSNYFNEYIDKFDDFLFDYYEQLKEMVK